MREKSAKIVHFLSVPAEGGSKILECFTPLSNHQKHTVLNEEVLYIYKKKLTSLLWHYKDAVYLVNKRYLKLKNICKYCLLKISQKDVLSAGCFIPPDILSPQTFSPPDVLSLQTLCPHGCFVPPDVVSHGRYVSGCYVAGRFVSGRFVPPDVLSLDVLSGHLHKTVTHNRRKKKQQV